MSDSRMDVLSLFYRSFPPVFVSLDKLSLSNRPPTIARFLTPFPSTMTLLFPCHLRLLDDEPRLLFLAAAAWDLGVLQGRAP